MPSRSSAMRQSRLLNTVRANASLRHRVGVSGNRVSGHGVSAHGVSAYVVEAPRGARTVASLSWIVGLAAYAATHRRLGPSPPEPPPARRVRHARGGISEQNTLPPGPGPPIELADTPSSRSAGERR